MPNCRCDSISALLKDRPRCASSPLAPPSPWSHPSPHRQIRVRLTCLFWHEPQLGDVSPSHPASVIDVQNQNPSHPASRARLPVLRGPCLPDEPVLEQVPRSGSSFARTGRFEKFPQTRGVRCSKASSRSCPYGLISALPINRLR